MTALPAISGELPPLTLTEALESLTCAYRALGILDAAYATLNQRLTEHATRAQCLSEALAHERAMRMDLQAQLAEIERQRRFITPIALSVGADR